MPERGKVEPKYAKAIRRLSDVIRTLEAADVSRGDVQEWLDKITGEVSVMPTLLGYLNDPESTAPLVQQVCRVLLMLLTMAHADETRHLAFAERVRAVVPELPQCVLGRLTENTRGDAMASLITLAGVAMRLQPDAGFDTPVLVTKALDLLSGQEHLGVLCNFLVVFVANTMQEDVLDAFRSHENAQLVGEVLAQLLNEPLGVGRSELFASDVAGCIGRAQVLAHLLYDDNGFLYRNDLRVVLEVLARDLPSCARSQVELADAFIDCADAVLLACVASNLTYQAEVAVFDAVSRDEIVPAELRDRLRRIVRRHAGVGET